MLERTLNDANDLAKDLEEIGFDKKNIKVANNLKNKEAFDREFNAFLKTIESGDTVLFYFSGHGFGVEVNKTNYLLLADIKSPFTYTRSQIPEKDRKNDDVVRLRISTYLDAYQRDEIAKSGFSAIEIENRLAERAPKSVIMILDACRSLLSADPVAANSTSDPKTSLKRGNESGSRLVTDHVPPPGFVIMYSASFGEQALEKLPGTDRGRNSLFTSVLRSELQRPGQSLTELGERVRLMVRVIANKAGRQQEPEFAGQSAQSDSFLFVDSIGRERFRLSHGKCDGAEEDWEQIKDLQKRELYDRHRRRFDLCKTGEFARRALIQLQLTADDSIEQQSIVLNRSINECDQLAAADHDRARPPEVVGVPFEKLKPDEAISACKKAAADNPRVTRYLFNLGRALQKRVAQPGISPTDLENALREARLSYDEAARRGYVSALNNLAVLYEYVIETNNLAVLAEAGGALAFQREAAQKDTIQKDAIELLKRAAQQGHPLAMYNLALHYRDGIGGLRRDIYQAAELLARSAESGFAAAMVEHGVNLIRGRGVLRSPRRGVEWLQRAAEAGSARAKFHLGVTYGDGAIALDRQGKEDSTNTVRPDAGLALLWLARVAEAGDAGAQARLASLMEDGSGLPNPQPEIAERYWRLAAHGGNVDAQAEFADRLRRGLILVKQEYGEQEAVNLLDRAMSQGSPKATLARAQISRTGELNSKQDPIEAMRLAYRTIELAVQTDPTTEEGNPFHEIAAAHILVEMAKNGEAIDAAGRSLLSESEVGRMERYYGIVDPVSRQVKVRRLLVPLRCGFVGAAGFDWTLWRYLWVWDWGRSESPTESQFRNLERTTGCTNNDLLRNTLIDVFEQSKKSNVAFADLIDQKIKTAIAQRPEPEPTKRSRRRGR